MTATHWYLLGCASGSLATLIVVVFAVIAVLPDLKQGWRR